MFDSKFPYILYARNAVLGFGGSKQRCAACGLVGAHIICLQILVAAWVPFVLFFSPNILHEVF